MANVEEISGPCLRSVAAGHAGGQGQVPPSLEVSPGARRHQQGCHLDVIQCTALVRGGEMDESGMGMGKEGCFSNQGPQVLFTIQIILIPPAPVMPPHSQCHPGAAA